MAAPTEVPDVPVYAGDTCVFPSYTFQAGTAAIDLVAEGWTNWTATWRRGTHAEESIPLAVNTAQAASGIIGISASATQTRAMGSAGVWDLQAERPGEVRTFLMGSTTYRQDVTRV